MQTPRDIATPGAPPTGYEGIYRRHVAPAFVALTLGALDGLMIARSVIAMPIVGEHRILTIAEVERLVLAHPAPYRPFVTFAAYVGTQAGEQRALTWDDVSVERQLARINKTLFRNRPPRYTKTGFDRLVPLPPHVATVLAEWRAICAPSVAGYVFPSRSGGPLDLDTYCARVFRPAVARAGLPSILRFHDLRHTTASLLLASGATVRDVRAIWGWRQPATVRRYLHPSVTLASATQRLSEVRAAALSSDNASAGPTATRPMSCLGPDLRNP